MSEEMLEAAAEAEENPGSNAVALNLALDGASRDPRLSEAIASFLARQESLLAKQSHHLDEQTRRIGLGLIDQRLTMALKILTVIVGVVLACGVATTVWKATEARGLVVDAFSAPPDFAQRGIGGDVVAEDVMGKLVTIRSFAMDHSYSISNDVTKDGGDIKVEIPETGVSITEAWRLLRGWLGHERHVAGSLREFGDGKIVLTATVDGEEIVSLSGVPADLASLEENAAEQIFGRFDPVNQINYLAATGRTVRACAAAAAYVQIAQTMLERSDAYSLWSYTTAFATGDLDLAIDRTRVAIDIDPNLAVAHIQLMRFERIEGRDESVLAEALKVLSLKDADQPLAHQGRGFANMRMQSAGLIGKLTGDFTAASEWECAHQCSLAQQRIYQSHFAALRHDVAAARMLIRQALAAGLKSESDFAEAQYWIAAETGDWVAAAADAKRAAAADRNGSGDMNPRYIAATQATRYTPLQAQALVRLGDFAAAHAAIDKTSGDCYDCVRARGAIDALQKNWGGAAYWFSDAVKQAPSIPFAYYDWGRMLLAKGDFDGAIARFAAASQKGPHFADPLEAWGEALMAKNRSDLALAKFAEAARYVPNWGRLHLKWGEALLWSGDKPGAAKQFALAAKLDLTADDRAQLTRIEALHG